MSREEVLQELSKRYSSNQLNAKQVSIYDELSARGILPPIKPSEFNIETSPIPVDKTWRTQTEETIPNKWGTDIGSEQTRMLAEQTPGQAPIDAEGFSNTSGEYAFPKVPLDAQKRADAGVDIYSGGPASLRAKASTVPNSEQATFIKENLEKSLGYKSELRKDPNGKLEFLKKTKDGKMRWASFDETGLSMGDLAAGLETGPALVGDIAGTLLAGAKATKMGAPMATMVESAGAGIGTTVAEVARLGVGKALGYHDAPVWGEATTRGGEAFTASMIGGFTIGGAQRLVRGSGGGLSSGDIEDILQLQNPKAVEAQIAINKKLAGTEGGEDVAHLIEQAGPLPENAYKSRLIDSYNIPENELPASLREQADNLYDIPSSEARLKLSAGQTSQGRVTPDMEATARADSRKADIAGRARDADNINAFEDYFDLLTGDRSTDYYNAGKEVQAVLRQQTAPRLQSLRDRVKDYTSDASDDISKLGSTDISKMAQDMQMSVVEQRRALKGVESAKWQEIDKQAGYNPDTDSSKIKIPRSEELDTSLARMKLKVKNSLFSREGKLKDELLSKELVTKENFDLVPLNRSISYLKKLQRQSESGLHPDLPDRKDILDVLIPMETMRNEHLAKVNPALLKTIEDAQALTVARVNLFDDGAVGKMLRKSNGKYYLDDKGVLDTVFAKGKGESARQYATAVMGDPRAMQAARNHIHAMYRVHVAPDGIPDRKLHKKFMDEFGVVMKPFFKQEDFTKLNRLGKVSEVINSYNNKLTRVEKAFEKSLRGRVKNMSPENTVPAFFKTPSKESPSGFIKDDVSKLKSYLESADPVALDRYKQSVSAEIRSKISKGDDKGFSSDSLDKLLKSTGDLESRGKISELFGNQYVADLRILKTGLKAFEKQGKAYEKITQGVVAMGSKAVMGPLHPKSRMVTFFERFRLKSTDETLFNVLSNPEKLRILLRNRNIDSTSRRAAEIYTSIGALTAINEE